MTIMKSVAVSKSRVRDFLATNLAHNIIDAEIEDLILVLRYNALGGFEFLSDEDLYENFAVSLPELSFMELTSADDQLLHLSVRKEHADDEDNILIDIKRRLQII